MNGAILIAIDQLSQEELSMYIRRFVKVVQGQECFFDHITYRRRGRIRTKYRYIARLEGADPRIADRMRRIWT